MLFLGKDKDCLTVGSSEAGIAFTPTPRFVCQGTKQGSNTELARLEV